MVRDGFMSKIRKIGIVLILSGFCLSLVSFNYAHGYTPGLGLIGNILGEERTPTSRIIIISELGKADLKYRYRPMYIVIFGETILYKYIVALSIVLILIGLGIFLPLRLME